MRKNKKINIIYKDDQIVVCEKPKGIPVSSDKTGDMDLLHQLKNQLFFEENTDGEPQLYLVHSSISCGVRTAVGSSKIRTSLSR